jgi:hypothetical protein
VGPPELLRVVLTVVFAAITLTCVARLLTRPQAGLPARHDDVAHVVKGVGMIAMLLSWTRLVPMPFWVLVFAGLAVFFAALLLRSAGGTENWDHVDHVVGSIGMIYMVVAMGGPTTGMAGMSASPLAMSFGLYFLAFGAWSGVRALRPVAVRGTSLVLGRPMVVHGCRALAAGGMAYLLLVS